jgi:hypothetical protein
MTSVSMRPAPATSSREEPRRSGEQAIPIRTPLAHAEDLDRLGDEIAELSVHLEAATARLLDLIREFDARGGWSNGFRSCAAWLSWRVGFAPGAAREHVRVARALGTLPLLARALARGELSYAKVRELTRVASETEERLLAVGRAGTAEHVERIVRGSPAAEHGSARAITSVIGPRAAPRRSPTLPCSVAVTTGPSTRRATVSSAGRTASWSSGDPMDE